MLKSHLPGYWITIFINPTWRDLFLPGLNRGGQCQWPVILWKDGSETSLLLNKAELNLTDEEKNVEQQIENYRSSLLIYAYEQSYIRQHLDTVVTDT